MKRLLVTGATGFLGRHVSKLLGAGGFEVHTASRTKDGGRECGTVEHVTDLLAAGAPTALVQSIQPSHLLHLAWSTPRSQSWMGIENLAWVSASLELFRAFVETGGKRAVFAGSCAEYDWAYENLHEIETPARSWTLYGTAKNAVRDLVEMTGRQSGVSTAWARIFFLYGPYEPPGRLVSDVACALLAGRPAKTTHGRQQRDFIHVADAARALVALIDGDHTGTVNVASGECVPVRKVVEILGRLARRPDLLAIGARVSPAQEPLRLAADVNRLHKELGFSPRFPLEEGLMETLDWWRARMARE